MKIRIGLGVDTHKLVKNRNLMLGGIHIPSALGCQGHSDADVLIHAICDALLGAVNLRDIGYHFPDTDNEYKDIDSKILLTKTHQLIQSKGWKIINIDSTIVIEQPKLSPYIALMKESLANVLKLEIEDISIKAKTSEKLGFIGREEGVSAYAVVLVEKQA
ncbi:MAG TPA: 2-C-methyl-D-erythritol 2,4-cyclodiphosphate synthase [Bacteroidales bacterium]|jgi:2-C-methyl-D-erythritol 2,4-cyclodiphosphate synthase|nr:2-C-methyl-D-erythritol 2,4-cyclodiphosphate synthase [Bacteroidales bacterium]HOR81673.1 2-C-methyl-D-erythritol 2,4-cyclodiphosphate synthase [Bacteroidales bacterium]HPJ90905.1 2-C-methyl-D-erythritol 2,4-cyclodiphosphate synthase [Bacteroidales bacterium]HPX59286.1 2-C-methyl-D-erythritol 2,4-cyclodiphosphate synthase [Bacteroidales bacterium]HQB20516.1 2-C-methyl-D-erythritol 2,4-cyclodiphosphate synthase [Bacteroidales bacterium]